MAAPLRIIGNHISPFVRKVLVVCEIKGLAYEVDSIVPFFGNDRFTQLSPMRRIPVFIDGDIVINDSSVICEYLEEKWPLPAVLPSSLEARAEARFLDEFADTRIADVVLWKVFGRALIAPAIFGSKRDVGAIEETISQELPDVMDLLERWAPEAGFKFGDTLGVADISVAVHFANFRWARREIDVARWGRAAAWIARVSAAPPLNRLNDIGARLVRVAPDAHRDVLAELGVRMTEQTVGTKTPRRGPMTLI